MEEHVGFRFYPTEEELLCYYLPKKLNGPTPHIDRVIPLLRIYDYSPWELPQFAGEVCRGDREQWFFFTAMQEREARGGRTNRLTQNGYWKATGSPCDVFDRRNLRIGRKKTMVFYEGRAPHGSKTTWKMNEYKLYHQSSISQLREELSLCRIYKKSEIVRAFDRRPPAEEAAVIAIRNPTAVENDEFDWDMATDQIESLEDSDIQMLLNWFDI
ncbi:NAC domain-containing protein 90-like isoform X2 [Salvia miltiorrhiza]|uniref:NAC domain-containing protein 90-like isoform X2 n=1 Tax=Salvia miltiorrhiza TaxID=226208 RepID=UPI0025AD68D0|nr:NAC domain-containing protein 90-like isoform X2 [Salvia miltiorrhiza]